MAETTTVDVGSTEEMHLSLAEMSTMHPELRKTGDCAQADHVQQ